MITGAHAIIYSTNPEADRARMTEHKIGCSAAQTMGWGVLTNVELPGGGKHGVYQPRHGRP
jgi:hypothetical protein